jgi:hypothetical protein
MKDINLYYPVSYLRSKKLFATIKGTSYRFNILEEQHIMTTLRTVFLTLALAVIAACGPAAAPAPEAVIRAWADAAKAGDYATAQQSMAGDDFAKMTWREPHERYRKAGHLQEYTIVDGPTATGQSTTATLRWTGSAEPTCITVQVGPDGKITPLSDYDVCKS